jgi:release factor glutamine methyltransferase
MTILEALGLANNKLKNERANASPMLDAQLILAHILRVTKNYLFLHGDRELKPVELETFEGCIERRMRHEPVAYLTGAKEFFKRTFFVNPFVLIPRPETETLIEHAIEVMGESHDALIVDVGTGSGAIAVTLAAETGAPIIATDISERALAVARQNSALHKTEHRITFLLGHLLQPVPPRLTRSVKHMILCANLPYLTTRQWETAEKEVQMFEPRLALDGGVDGFAVYAELLAQLKKRRRDFPKQTTFLFEIDPEQRPMAERMVHEHFPKNPMPHFSPDLSGKIRVVVCEL